MALFSKKAVLPLVWIPVFVISGLDTLFDFAWFDKAIDFLESGLPYAGILTGLILLAFLSAGRLSESRLPVWKKSWKFWLVVSTALVTVVMDFGGMYYYGFGSSRTFPLLYEGIAAAIVIFVTVAVVCEKRSDPNAIDNGGNFSHNDFLRFCQQVCFRTFKSRHFGLCIDNEHSCRNNLFRLQTRLS